MSEDDLLLRGQVMALLEKRATEEKKARRYRESSAFKEAKILVYRMPGTQIREIIKKVEEE